MVDQLFNFKNKTILVTGASRGIGRAIAEGFVAHGARVYGAGSRPESVEWMKSQAPHESGGTLTGVTIDVRDPGATKTVLEKITAEHGRLDCLINNAGIASNSPAKGIKEDEMEDMIDINFKGVFRNCQAYYQLQRKSGGVIINVASILGLIGAPLAAVYAGTKAAILNMTRALAIEWAGNDFRVNALAPGFVDTDMTELIKKKPAVLEKMLSVIPLKRMGKPEDMVGACLFMASDAAAYMTGQMIVVDGGVTAQ